MSSILTNTSAMTALQTLKNINSNLETTQREISTGKSVGSAKDNAALWSISKVMEADVSGFKAIQDSLNLGEATLNVARNAAESTGDLLNQIKEKVVTAQESNVDRTKLQADIEQLRDQISSVVGAAQFNGLNMLQNTDTAAGSGTNDILSSLDRAADQSVASSSIAVGKQDLGQGASAIDTSTGATAGSDNTTGGSEVDIVTGGAVTGDPGSDLSITTIDEGAVAAGVGYEIVIGSSGGAVESDTAVAGSSEVRYVARDGDTAADVATGLANSLNTWFARNDDADVYTATAAGGELTIENVSGVAANTATFALSAYQGGTIGGGLEALSNIDVTTDAGARGALAAVEGLIQTTIDASAELGSAANRVEVQSEFVGNLTDSFKAGIGSLVDANMEEASARLQALQTQQQLGIQALSIANSAPQNILSLFR